MTGRWRSLLFVAAHDERRLAKIATRGADAVILDLEDAVPEEHKASARAGLPEIVARLASESIQVVVRINKGWRASLADLEAAIRPGTAVIMVPKVEEAAYLRVMNEMVVEIAANAGISRLPPFIALIESPLGLDRRGAIARAPNLIGLALGSEDFSLALGVAPTQTALDMPCRMLAVTAASHGLMAFGAPLSIATIADESAWEAALEQARAIGITGALCIHPNQVAAANSTFNPTQAEEAWAREILTVWNASGASGVLQVGGQMVDRPVVLAAQRILAIIDKTV